jgi:hypothetical protein
MELFYKLNDSDKDTFLKRIKKISEKKKIKDIASLIFTDSENPYDRFNKTFNQGNRNKH